MCMCITRYVKRIVIIPVDNIYDAGISISVNSDTRTLVAATLTEEYEKMHHAFGWDKEHFLQCNLNALNAAFIPEPVKQRAH